MDRSDMDRFSREIRSRENRSWQRHGPIIYRLRSLLIALGFLVMTYVMSIVFLTANSLYPGTGSIRPLGPSEQMVHARVEDCHRVGPVSSYGFGYWRECGVLLQAGSKEAKAVIGRSIVEPTDVGKLIELREACFGPTGFDCKYGKPTGLGWQFYVGALRILRLFLAISLLASSAVFLARAVLGAPRYFALRDRLASRGW